jgi:hypothetical protein
MRSITSSNWGVPCHRSGVPGTIRSQSRRCARPIGTPVHDGVTAFSGTETVPTPTELPADPGTIAGNASASNRQPDESRDNKATGTRRWRATPARTARVASSTFMQADTTTRRLLGAPGSRGRRASPAHPTTCSLETSRHETRSTARATHLMRFAPTIPDTTTLGEVAPETPGAGTTSSRSQPLRRLSSRAGADSGTLHGRRCRIRPCDVTRPAEW